MINTNKNMHQESNEDSVFTGFQKPISHNVCQTGATSDLRTDSSNMLPGGAVHSKDVVAGAEETEEEKRIRRIMANRKSAKESRDRRRKLLNTLSKQVEVLAAENESMARANSDLRSQTQFLKEQLRMALAMARQQGPSSTKSTEFSDYDMTPDDEPLQLSSMVKSDCLEPFHFQDADSLWNTNDVWEPLLSV